MPRPQTSRMPRRRHYARPDSGSSVHIMLETVFGPTLTLSSGKVIPTRWVGEQHVKEDLGFIPSFADWMRAIRPCPGWGAPAASRTGPLPKIAAQSERRAGVGGEPGGKRERLPGSPPLPLSAASPMSRICTAPPFDFRNRVAHHPNATPLFHAPTPPPPPPH